MQSPTHMPSYAVHPMLILLPLCLLGISVLFDAAGRLSGTPVWGTLAYANLVAGLLIALLGTGVQLAQSRLHLYGASSYRLISMSYLLNVTALVLFGLSLVYRIHDPTQLPESAAFYASVIGLFVLAIGGWLSALQRASLGR